MENWTVNSSEGHASGSWYKEMDRKIKGKMHEIHEVRMDIDKDYRRLVVLNLMRAMAVPFLACGLKAIKKLLSANKPIKK